MAWIKEFTRVKGTKDGFNYRDDDHQWKLLLHTTETPTGTALRLAQIHNWSPHFWVDPHTGEMYQVIDTDRAGYALANKAGGVETNGDRVIQIEIIGYHYDTPHWTDAKKKWFGENVVAPIFREHPIDRNNFVVQHVPTQGGVWARSNAPSRLQGADWDNYSGTLGHQNAPENDHVDPGGLDVATILHYANAKLNSPSKPAPAPPPPPPAPADPLDQVIRRGSPVELVKEVQKILVQWSLYPSAEIDGNYGPKTELGVKHLQTKIRIHHKSRDGIWGPQTYAAYKEWGDKLQEIAPEPQLGGYKHYRGSVLSTKYRNIKRDDVAEIQFLLNFNNGNQTQHWLDVDGKYGNFTAAEVQRFQKVYNIFFDPNISVDGEFGPQTANALALVLRKKGIW